MQARRGVGFADHEQAALGRAVLADRLDDARDRRRLLTDGGIDANHVARFLVDDGIDGDGGLAGLAVADDEFALAAAERDHRVDDEEPGRQRPRHQRPVDDRRGGLFHGGEMRRHDRALAVERRAERVDHAAEQGVADGNARDFAGAVDDATRGDALVLAEEDAADGLVVEIDGKTAHAAGKDQQFVEPGSRQAANDRHAVADLSDVPDMFEPRFERERGEPLAATLEPVVKILSERRHGRQAPIAPRRARSAR